MKPFQVMCVFIGSEPEYNKEEEPMMITVGTEYTVISKIKFPGGLCYELAHQQNVAYPAEFFATLPLTTDEVETEHQHEAIIYQR